MHHSIPEDVVSLDIESIDFNNKYTLKILVLNLFDTTEQSVQANHPVDKDVLPPDTEFKGYRHMIKQNIKFETDNVEYILERYHSTNKSKVYEAELPEDVRYSEFGSDLKSFVMHLYYSGRVTENKIWKILEEMGSSYPKDRFQIS